MRKIECLVVVTHAGIRESLPFFLQALADASVTSFEGGEDALRTARERRARGTPPYDVAFVDNTLYQRDGIDVVTVIENEGLARACVLMSSDERLGDAIAPLPHTHFLAKPFGLEELRGALESTGALRS